MYYAIALRTLYYYLILKPFIMKVQPYVIVMADREEAESLEGTVFGSFSSITANLQDAGIGYRSVQCLSDFMDDWNDCDDDDLSMVNILKATFISYVYVNVKSI